MNHYDQSTGSFHCYLFITEDPSLNLDSAVWEIHVLTGALKLFFRELAEPLFPIQYFDKFEHALSK